MISGDVVEVLTDDEFLESIIAMGRNIQNEAEVVFGLISNFAKKIGETKTWSRNGKEDCANLLFLLENYSAYIAGYSGAVKAMFGDAALSDKNISGSSENHIEGLLEALSYFNNESMTYEMGKTARSVKILDSIQED